MINHKLLADYHFKYVEAYFLEPDISNPDDLYKILTVCNNAGGLTPNKAKSILYKAMGEIAEDYEGDWGDVPLSYAENQSTTASTGFDRQIQKSVENNDVEITAVLKEIRALLTKSQNSKKNGYPFTENSDIIKYNEDQPRDENGRWTDGSGTLNGGFSRPTLQLPKKEYAKVMSEINTVYHARYEGKREGVMYINDYGYFFEIKSYNEYNIYDKEKIE